MGDKFNENLRIAREKKNMTQKDQRLLLSEALPLLWQKKGIRSEDSGPILPAMC